MTLIEEQDKDEFKDHRAFTNLYVKCFPAHFKEQDLSELFGGFGPIQAVKVMTDPRGRSFGFVNFEQHEDAKMCIQEMHRKDLRPRKEIKEAKRLEAEGKAPVVKFDVDGHPEHLLYVGRAQSKEERAAMFQKQYGDKGPPKGVTKGKGKGDDCKGNGKSESKGEGKGGSYPFAGKSSALGSENAFETQPVITSTGSTHGTSAPQEASLPYSNGSSPWQPSQQMYPSSYGNGSYHEGSSFRSGSCSGCGSSWAVGDNGCTGWESGWSATRDGANWQGSFSGGWENGWGGNGCASSYGGCDGYDGNYGSSMSYQQTSQYGLVQRPQQKASKGYHWQV